MKRLPRILLLIGLALALGAGLLIWQGDRVLQGMLRPALERAVAAGVGGEARLGGLELGWNRLVLLDLHLRKPEALQFDLPRGEATWTFASLLRQRLVTLDLAGPRLQLLGPSREEPGPLPPANGFPFDYLRIQSGALGLPLGTGALELRELALELADGAPPILKLQGVAGAAGVPFDLSGTLAWNQGFELDLGQLLWDGAERLAGPLSLSLERDRRLQGRGTLQFAALDGPTLERWAKALGGESVWPQGLELALEGVHLEADVNPEQVSAKLKLTAGVAQGEDWTLPWQDLELTLGGSPERWQGEGLAKLAGRFPLQLEARGASGRVSLQGRLAELGAGAGAGGTLQASASRESDGRWQGEASLDRLRSQDLAAVLELLGRPSPLPKEVQFDLKEPRLQWQQQAASAQLALSLPAAQVQGEGWNLPLADLQWTATLANGGWSGEGALRLAGAATRLTGHYRGGVASGSLNLISSQAASLLRELGLGDWPLAGGFELGVEGRLQARVFDLSGRWQGRSQGAVSAPTQLDLGALEATARLRRSAGALRGAGELSVAGHPLLQAAGDARRLLLRLRPSSWPQLEKLLPPASRPALLQGGEGLSAEVLVERMARGWQAQGSGQAAALRLEPGTLEGLSWAATLTPTAAGMHLGAGRLSARLQTPLGQIEQVRLQAEADLDQSEYRLRLQRLEAEGIELLSPDGLAGLTGGHLAGNASVSGRRDGGAVALQLDVQGGVKELLAGSFYGDFTGLEAALALTANLEPKAQRLQAERLDLRLGELARGNLAGTLGPAGGSLRGTLEGPRLAALEAQLLPALAAAYPALAGLRLEGGLTLEGEGRWSEQGWRLQGEARPRRLGLRWPGPGLELEGLEGVLPLDLGSATAAPAAATIPGRLTLERLQAGPLSLPAGELALRVGANHLAFDAPLDFALAGGDLEVADLAIGRGPGGLELAAQVRLGEVDLQRLTEELKLPPLQGRLSANLGTIDYADEELKTAGAAGINAFDGGILVSNIRLKSPFSSYRTLEADIDFEAIDLHELTRTFAFGEINGIADGHIHGLRLFGTTPSAFEAAFATRLEGRRNISVKALKNLSILSQGGLQAALSRGIYRFIDFYRYRRIGFVCSLENDLFRLRGTAREGSDRYLIHGGWLPPKIDIVAPGRHISFKEMVKRLGRLDRGAAQP